MVLPTICNDLPVANKYSALSRNVWNPLWRMSLNVPCVLLYCMRCNFFQVKHNVVSYMREQVFGIVDKPGSRQAMKKQQVQIDMCFQS